MTMTMMKAGRVNPQAESRFGQIYQKLLTGPKYCYFISFAPYFNFVTFKIWQELKSSNKEVKHKHRNYYTSALNSRSRFFFC